MSLRSTLLAVAAAALFAGCSSGAATVPQTPAAPATTAVGSSGTARGPLDTSGGLPFSASFTMYGSVFSAKRAAQSYSAADAVALSGTISGVIFYAGQNDPGVTVQLVSSTNGRTFTGTTDGNGSISFGAVPSDTYFVVANGNTISAQNITVTRK